MAVLLSNNDILFIIIFWFLLWKYDCENNNLIFKMLIDWDEEMILACKSDCLGLIPDIHQMHKVMQASGVGLK